MRSDWCILRNLVKVWWVLGVTVQSANALWLHDSRLEALAFVLYAVDLFLFMAFFARAGYLHYLAPPLLIGGIPSDPSLTLELTLRTLKGEDKRRMKLACWRGKPPRGNRHRSWKAKPQKNELWCLEGRTAAEWKLLTSCCGAGHNYRELRQSTLVNSAPNVREWSISCVLCQRHILTEFDASRIVRLTRIIVCETMSAQLEHQFPVDRAPDVLVGNLFLLELEGIAADLVERATPDLLVPKTAWQRLRKALP